MIGKVTIEDAYRLLIRVHVIYGKTTLSAAPEKRRTWWREITLPFAPSSCHAIELNEKDVEGRLAQLRSYVFNRSKHCVVAYRFSRESFLLEETINSMYLPDDLLEGMRFELETEAMRADRTRKEDAYDDGQS